jgi:hypothetical protein
VFAGRVLYRLGRFDVEEVVPLRSTNLIINQFKFDGILVV